MIRKKVNRLWKKSFPQAADQFVLLNLQTCHRITVENHVAILPCVLHTNADDLPCV